HEHQRAEPGDADGRDGAPGEVPEPDDPRLGLRRELRAAHEGAADGRDQPHLPRVGVMAVSSAEPSLGAQSPYELRVDLGKGVPETDVRSALKTGDMGFLHSFTTGSAVDGPGIRVVAWTAGCMW